MEKMTRNATLVGVAIVALAIAAVVTFGGFGREGALPQAHISYCVSLATGEDVVVEHQLDELPPYKCESSGELAVYPWLYCYDCNVRFIPDLVRDEETGLLRYPRFPVCPACGGDGFGSYVPELPNQQPIGDVPLPEWNP